MSTALALSSFERPYCKGRQYFESIVSFLDSREGNEMELSELERELKNFTAPVPMGYKKSRPSA